MTYGKVALDNAILQVGFRPRRNSDIVVGRKPNVQYRVVYSECNLIWTLAVVFVLHGCRNPNDA